MAGLSETTPLPKGVVVYYNIFYSPTVQHLRQSSLQPPLQYTNAAHIEDMHGGGCGLYNSYKYTQEVYMNNAVICLITV